MIEKVITSRQSRKACVPHIFIFLTIEMVSLLSGCMASREHENDTLDSHERVHLIIDSSATFLTRLPELGPISQADMTQRMAFVQQWVHDCNSWFLPFAARYISSLKLEGQKRILPVINKDPLITSLNRRDIRVNLAAPDWKKSSPDALTITMRKQLVRSALDRNFLLLNKTPTAKKNEKKEDIIKSLFLSGIPAYISSFGIPVEDSPLSNALSGDRELIEAQFAILRSPLNNEKDIFLSDNEPDVKNTPEEFSNAFYQTGIWICYRVETILGPEELITAISAGPDQLYEAYLATNPGILMSLETIPIDPVPLLNDSITH